MHARKLGILMMVGAAAALAACDDKAPSAEQEAKCKAFAEHVAEVLVAEHDNAEPVKRDEMVAATTKSCIESPPEAKALECAMKATTGRDIKACDAPAEK